MTDLNKYLNFIVGGEGFAIPLLKVREVIALPEVTPVPQSSSNVLGLINLRGQIITIFDMKLCMKLKSTQEDDLTVVICDMNSGQVGFVVDSVASVLSITSEELSDVPPGTRGAGHNYITSVHRREKELTLILDVEQLLTPEARQQVQTLNQKSA